VSGERRAWLRASPHDAGRPGRPNRTAAQWQDTARPAPGKWNSREIVHHIADSEVAAAFRLRLILAEDRPTIQGYDQDVFAQRLHYERPHEASLELFRYAREATAPLLDLMTPADWLREATHTKTGPFGPERWLQIYAGHAHKHARQILVARDAARNK